MDNVLTPEQLEGLRKYADTLIEHIRNGPTRPIRRPWPKIGRNEPCPCNSGRKFKKCCGK
jgi:uncharacterized protein YecA (UPF0149 family)